MLEVQNLQFVCFRNKNDKNRTDGSKSAGNCTSDQYMPKYIKLTRSNS